MGSRGETEPTRIAKNTTSSVDHTTNVQRKDAATSPKTAYSTSYATLAANLAAVPTQKHNTATSQRQGSPGPPAETPGHGTKQTITTKPPKETTRHHEGTKIGRRKSTGK